MQTNIGHEPMNDSHCFGSGNGGHCPCCRKLKSSYRRGGNMPHSMRGRNSKRNTLRTHRVGK